MRSGDIFEIGMGWYIGMGLAIDFSLYSSKGPLVHPSLIVPVAMGIAYVPLLVYGLILKRREA